MKDIHFYFKDIKIESWVISEDCPSIQDIQLIDLRGDTLKKSL